MKKRQKNILLLALNLFGRIVICTVMCAFLYVTYEAVGTTAFGQEVGYTIYTLDENGDNTEVHRVVYAEGDYTLLDELKLESNQRVQVEKKMSNGVAIAVDVFASACMLFILGVFPYNLLWEQGKLDENAFRHSKTKGDKLRGLKVGILASIPAFLLYVLLLLGKFVPALDGFIATYRGVSWPFLPYINAIVGASTKSAADISAGKLIALAVTLLFVPAISGLAYLLGLRKYSLEEHITYENVDKNDTDDTI